MDGITFARKLCDKHKRLSWSYVGENRVRIFEKGSDEFLKEIGYEGEDGIRLFTPEDKEVVTIPARYFPSCTKEAEDKGYLWRNKVAFRGQEETRRILKKAGYDT